jgi:hypothetical protein
VRIPDSVSEKLNSLYPARYEGIRHCLGLIIVNLLEFGEVAYSRKRNWYTENHAQNYTFASMMGALEIAIADGYAELRRKGYRSKGFEKGWSSTIGAGPRLTEFRLPEKMQLDLEALPLISVDRRPIFRIEDLKFVAEKGAKEKYQLNYYQALLLNRNYWNKMIVDSSQIGSSEKCFHRVGLTRIFKGEEVGRWFQKGFMSYQQLSEGEREKLLLNGEKVREIDYSAMHPHILYAKEGKQCPDNFYKQIEDKCGCSKFVAKSVTLIAINSKSFSSLTAAINSNKGKVERANRRRAIPDPVLYNVLKKYNLKAKDVVEAIEAVHPAIAKYIYSASANELMLIESEIMTAVLMKLMALKISALPVHDSVIVPSRHEGTARQIMHDIFTEQTGFSAAIK